MIFFFFSLVNTQIKVFKISNLIKLKKLYKIWIIMYEKEIELKNFKKLKIRN